MPLTHWWRPLSIKAPLASPPSPSALPPSVPQRTSRLHRPSLARGRGRRRGEVRELARAESVRQGPGRAAAGPGARGSALPPASPSFLLGCVERPLPCPPAAVSAASRPAAGRGAPRLPLRAASPPKRQRPGPAA